MVTQQIGTIKYSNGSSFMKIMNSDVQKYYSDQKNTEFADP